MLTEEIDHARDAMGSHIYLLNHLVGKEWGTGATGGSQTSGNVSSGLFLSENWEAGVDHDALAQLAKLRQTEFLFQFRLAGEDDLQEFAARRLEIQQQSKLIERLHW